MLDFTDRISERLCTVGAQNMDGFAEAPKQTIEWQHADDFTISKEQFYRFDTFLLAMACLHSL